MLHSPEHMMRYFMAYSYKQYRSHIVVTTTVALLFVATKSVKNTAEGINANQG